MPDQLAQDLMDEYLKVLVDRGDFARFLADDVEFSVPGTPLHVRGRKEVEQAIRSMHEQSFDARPELRSLTVGDGSAAIEADFVGTHVGEFSGVPATGKSVRVPYAVIYDLDGDKITALRGYGLLAELMAQIGPAA